MECPTIIDNRDENSRLDTVLNRFILPHTDECCVASGYFYASGFEQIQPALLTNPRIDRPNLLRILISPRTDRLTARLLTAGHDPERPEPREVIDQLIQEFEGDLNDVSAESARTLLELLQRDTIQLRLYVSKFFHAKAYLARTERADIHDHYAIVGSSNFSRSGLTANSELNLCTREPANHHQLKTWFDQLWTHEAEDFNPALIRILQKAAASRPPVAAVFLSPFQTLLFMLRHYLGVIDESALADTDQLAEFQRIGAENALNKLQRLGGAILSDSVGLGKTFTAGEVIRRYMLRNKRVLVLVPPTLLKQWRDTLKTSFQLEESPQRLVFFSQGKLSQLKASAVRKAFDVDFDLIVIDEAHRARNSETRLHRNINHLHPEGGRAKILLLTATPFNNSVHDLRNLIQLCMLDLTLTNAGFTPAAFDRFAELSRGLRVGQTMEDLARNPDFVRAEQQIRDILNNVLLLRMRSTIRERYGAVEIGGRPLLFEDPQVQKVDYDYQKKHHAFFNALNGFLAGLHLPHIVLANPESGRTLSYLYELLLFKRLESSLYAFYISLKNIKARELDLKNDINKMDWDAVLERYNRRRLEDSELDEDIFQEDTGDEAEFTKRIERADVLQWIDEDVRAVDNFITEYIVPLRKEPDDPLSLDDPKLEVFREILTGPGYRRALVFTGFRATVEYLEYRLKESNPELRLAGTTGGDSRLNEKLDRFAPRGRQIVDSPKERELDVLISTDVLAEGVNLQDADLLINFDLPWNPMRIVQRVGRVNRIGSENRVRVLNFAPDATLNRFLKLLEILSSKIKQVAALLGKEMAILSDAEEKLEPRVIGDELQKLHRATSLTELEKISARHSLLAQIPGETEEDFFRLLLFESARRLRVRSNDADTLPRMSRRGFYTALSERPQCVYRLYEIYGEREEIRDVLDGVWLRTRAGESGAEPCFPDEFLRTLALQTPGFTLRDLQNWDETAAMEKILDGRFAELLKARQELNAPSSTGRRMRNIVGVQAQVVGALGDLLREENLLIDKSFGEVADELRPNGREDLRRVFELLRDHPLSSGSRNLLSRLLRDRGVALTKNLSPAVYADFARVLFEFYDDTLSRDATLRGRLYNRTEIAGRLLLTIYV